MSDAVCSRLAVCGYVPSLRAALTYRQIVNVADTESVMAASESLVRPVERLALLGVVKG
jgi:hypothetical protein